jgi:hypothetical protein
MRVIYPSDITREQFSVIAYALQSGRKVTHPRKYNLRLFQNFSFWEDKLRLSSFL